MEEVNGFNYILFSAIIVGYILIMPIICSIFQPRTIVDLPGIIFSALFIYNTANLIQWGDWNFYVWFFWAITAVLCYISFHYIFKWLLIVIAMILLHFIVVAGITFVYFADNIRQFWYFGWMLFPASYSGVMFVLIKGILRPRSDGSSKSLDSLIEYIRELGK